MNYLISSIFGKRALGELSASDYVDWAGEMLMQGYDSYSLRILASLSSTESKCGKSARIFVSKILDELEATKLSADGLILPNLKLFSVKVYETIIALICYRFFAGCHLYDYIFRDFYF